MANISTYVGAGGGGAGGGEALTAASCINLTADNLKSLSVCFSQAGSLYLPDATSLELGAPLYTIKNVGSSTALIYDYCGNLYNYLNSQEATSVSLYNNACIEGGWTIEKPTTNLSSVIIESASVNPQGVTISEMSNCCLKYCEEQNRAYFIGYKGNCVYTSRAQWCSSSCSYEVSDMHQCCIGGGFTAAESARYPTAGMYYHSGLFEAHKDGIFINVACDGTACICCLTDLCYKCLGSTARYIQTGDQYSRVAYLLPVCGATCAQMSFMHFDCTSGISCQYCKIDVPITSCLCCIGDGPCNAGQFVYLGVNNCVVTHNNIGKNDPCLIWAIDFYTGYNTDCSYPCDCCNINRVEEFGNHWFIVQAPCIKDPGTCDFHYIESNLIGSSQWPCCSSGWNDTNTYCLGSKMCTPFVPQCLCDACQHNYQYDFLCSLGSSTTPKWQFANTRCFMMGKYVCLGVFTGGGGSNNCQRCSGACNLRMAGNTLVVNIPDGCGSGCLNCWSASSAGNCSCKWCGRSCQGDGYISNPPYQMVRVSNCIAIFQTSSALSHFPFCECFFTCWDFQCACTYYINWNSSSFGSCCEINTTMCGNDSRRGFYAQLQGIATGNKLCYAGDQFDTRIWNKNAAVPYYDNNGTSGPGARYTHEGAESSQSCITLASICNPDGCYEFYKLKICNSNAATSGQRFCLCADGFNCGCTGSLICPGRFVEYSCDNYSFAGPCGTLVQMARSGATASSCINCLDYSIMNWTGTQCCFKQPLSTNEDLYEAGNYLLKLCINPSNGAMLPCSTLCYDAGGAPITDFRQDSDEIYMTFETQSACLCKFIYPTLQFGQFDSDQGGVVKGSVFQSNTAPVSPSIRLRCGAGTGGLLTVAPDGTVKSLQFATACR